MSAQRKTVYPFGELDIDFASGGDEVARHLDELPAERGQPCGRCRGCRIRRMDTDSRIGDGGLGVLRFGMGSVQAGVIAGKPSLIF